MLLSCFYAYIEPIAVPIAIFTLCITYWSEKYLLLRRYTTPPNTSADLVEEMTDFFLEMYVLAFA